MDYQLIQFAQESAPSLLLFVGLGVAFLASLIFSVFNIVHAVKYNVDKKGAWIAAILFFGLIPNFLYLFMVRPKFKGGGAGMVHGMPDKEAAANQVGVQPTPDAMPSIPENPATSFNPAVPSTPQAAVPQAAQVQSSLPTIGLSEPAPSVASAPTSPAPVSTSSAAPAAPAPTVVNPQVSTAPAAAAAAPVAPTISPQAAPVQSQPVAPVAPAPSHDLTVGTAPASQPPSVSPALSPTTPAGVAAAPSLVQNSGVAVAAPVVSPVAPTEASSPIQPVSISPSGTIKSASVLDGVVAPATRSS